MDFFYKIKILKKNSDQRKALNNIIGKLPTSDIIAKDILNIICNKKTKVVFDNDIKGNYYVYLNDTIYLSNKQEEKQNYERLCVIAHECIHSKQPKILQNINFIFSNIEIIFFIMLLILRIFNIKNFGLLLSYLLIVGVAITARIILEMWATLKAPSLSSKYLKKSNIKKEEVDYVNNSYSFLTKLLIPLFIIKLTFFKILRIIIAIAITFIKI